MTILQIAGSSFPVGKPHRRRSDCDGRRSHQRAIWQDGDCSPSWMPGSVDRGTVVRPAQQASNPTIRTELLSVCNVGAIFKGVAYGEEAGAESWQFCLIRVSESHLRSVLQACVTIATGRVHTWRRARMFLIRHLGPCDRGPSLPGINSQGAWCCTSNRYSVACIMSVRSCTGRPTRVFAEHNGQVSWSRSRWRFGKGGTNRGVSPDGNRCL